MSKARPIDEAEFRRALKVASQTRFPQRDALCLLLSARTGMRVGEIQSLDVADVLDAEDQVRDRIFLAAERTKWRHAREVFLNRTVRSAIATYLEARSDTPGPLILTQSRQRFTRTALVSLFCRLYRNAGIETSSHAGRALFITSLADHGVSIRVIQKAVGHRSLSATNHYLSARPAELSAAVELLR